MTRLYFSFVLACLVFFVTVCSVQSQQYVMYCNARFGFCVDHPDAFQQETPSDNGDGIQLRDGKGLVMIASGINNATDGTLSTEMAEQGMSFDKITYQKKGDNWFVLSGFKGLDILYLKTYVGSGSINHLYIQYPVTQKEEYDSIVSQISHSFQPGGLTGFH